MTAAAAAAAQGRDWMRSKCTKEKQLSDLEPIMPLLSFEKIMERSLMIKYWENCSSHFPSSFKWLQLPEKELAWLKGAGQSRDGGAGGVSDGTPLYNCLRQRDAPLVAKFESELLGDWPPANLRKQLEQAFSLLGRAHPPPCRRGGGKARPATPSPTQPRPDSPSHAKPHLATPSPTQPRPDPPSRAQVHPAAPRPTARARAETTWT